MAPDSICLVHRTYVAVCKGETNPSMSRFWVTLARGSHPFPSRTRKLSPSAPIVLHARVCGRLGSRPVNSKSPTERLGFCVCDAQANESRRRLRFVCVDMWEPYPQVVAAQIGQALHILDRFRIASRLNQAVDQVRRAESTPAEQKQASGAAAPGKSSMRCSPANWPPPAPGI